MSKSAFLSGVTATASVFIAISLLTGAKAPPPKFEEIDVGRINIREPDGTIRMIISNKAQFPGAPWKGGEKPRPDRRDFAGMIFANDEGTEIGGLITKGVIGKDGKPDAGLSLTFDRFRQDQVLQLLHYEQQGQNSTFLAINDEPSLDKGDVVERMAKFQAVEALPQDQQQDELNKLRAAGQLPANRVRLGTTPGKASTLMLADAQGRTRLRLMVTAEGQPMIQMLDEKGKVAKTIGLDDASSPTGKP